MSQNEQGLGALSGSHPSDQARSGLGAPRFDPERWTADRLVALLDDWRSIPAADFHERYPDFVGLRHDYYDKWPNTPPAEATLDVVSKIATAIAMETQRAETENTGSVAKP